MVIRTVVCTGFMPVIALRLFHLEEYLSVGIHAFRRSAFYRRTDPVRYWSDRDLALRSHILFAFLLHYGRLFLWHTETHSNQTIPQLRIVHGDIIPNSKRDVWNTPLWLWADSLLEVILCKNYQGPEHNFDNRLCLKSIRMDPGLPAAQACDRHCS